MRTNDGGCVMTIITASRVVPFGFSNNIGSSCSGTAAINLFATTVLAGGTPTDPGMPSAAAITNASVTPGDGQLTLNFNPPHQCLRRRRHRIPGLCLQRRLLDQLRSSHHDRLDRLVELHLHADRSR